MSGIEQSISMGNDNKNCIAVLSGLPSAPIGLISETCAKRDQAVELVNRALDLIHEAQALLPSITIEPALIKISWYSANLERNKESLRKAIDARYWSVLFQESKLGAVMNKDQLDAANQDIRMSSPVLKYEDVINTFMSLFDSRNETFLNGFISVFKRLSKSYKSNDAFKVGRRLVLNNVFNGVGWGSFSSGEQTFKDFVRYVQLIRGCDPTAFDVSECPARAVVEARKAGLYELDFKDYNVKTFQNGNLHITLPDELVEKINDVIAIFYGGQIGHRK